MIKKLQKRFIRISLVALTAAMVLVAGVVNAVHWISVRSELNGTLDFLSEIGGGDLRGGPGGSRLKGKNKHTRNVVSESNWFSAVVDGKGAVRIMNLNSMADADEQAALALARQAAERGTDSAFFQEYLYRFTDNANGTRTGIFLNCETKIASLRTLALISLAACLSGILLAWLMVTLASRRAVEPTLRNTEQQKQFITNAGHELKTPLTVIGANMDILQMELPDNSWIQSTQKQVSQMRQLVDELVYLSRMEEENAPLAMEPLALKPLMEEAAEPFGAMAEYAGKEMRLEAEEGLRLTGNRESLQRLIAILCDNAVKYAAGEGAILITAKAEGKNVVLSVSNETEQPLTQEQCGRLFERFYRADASRNKEKQGGFGIGLAIAAAIAQKHGGGMSAAMGEGKRLVLTCTLPKAGKAS